jgi:hypothetical protein
MSNNTLVHYGHTQIEELNLVKQLAKDLNLKFIHDGIQQVSINNPKFPIASYWDFISHAKYASFIVIWNGMQCYGPLITSVCKNMNIPRCYMEWGLLPQSSNFLIDPVGFCGNSVLNYDLSWIDDNDMNFLYQKRDELQQEYKISDEDYILVPLQIENDSQVLYYSQYKNMHDFILDISNKYFDRKIFVKLHPKNNQDKYMKSWNIEDCVKFDSKRIFFIQDKNINFLTLASKASFIVGLTSTALYEAAILGKHIVSFGDHPLRNQSNNIDRVCAGILALNIDRKIGKIRPILDRFSPKYYQF